MNSKFVAISGLSQSPSQQMGTQAVTTTFTSWAATPTTSSKPRERKPKTTKRVIHPLFHEYARLSKDPYWIDFFTKAGYGKLPAKFSFKDGNLIYKKANRLRSEALPPNHMEGMWTAISFLRTHGGLSSVLDQERIQREELAFNAATINPNPEWKDISRKMRSVYITRFTEEQGELLHLGTYEKSLLRQTINIGINQHYFVSEDIAFQGGRIVGIRGLMYNPEQRLFYIDPNIKPKVQRSATKMAPPLTDPFPPSTTSDGVPRFLRNFKKYVKDQEKKSTRDGVIVHDSSLSSPSINGSLQSHPYSLSPSLTIMDEST